MNASTAVRDPDLVRDAQEWFAASSAAYLGAVVVLPPRRLPDPYRSLLVHQGSMTECLEHRFGGPLTIEILGSFIGADRYARWIQLFDGVGRCVEMGGVCLDLRPFDTSLRADILAGAEPLGRLLSRHRVPYVSVPRMFLGLSPSAYTRDLLQMDKTRRVFGRRTELCLSGRTLGEIIEVLPCYNAQIAARASRHARLPSRAASHAASRAASSG